MYLSFRFFNKYGSPVSDFQPEEVNETIVVFHNNEPLPNLVATTRVGEFRQKFIAVGSNAITVEYRQSKIFAEHYMAMPTF